MKKVDEFTNEKIKKNSDFKTQYKLIQQKVEIVKKILEYRIQHGLSQAPAAELGRPLSRAADVAPEIVEIVAPAGHIQRVVLVLSRLSPQAAGAEVLDDEETSRCLRVGSAGLVAADCREVLPQSGEPGTRVTGRR